METKIATKKSYLVPTVEGIKLDNDISLALQSGPPEGPGETNNLIPEYLKSKPYKAALS